MSAWAPCNLQDVRHWPPGLLRSRASLLGLLMLQASFSGLLMMVALLLGLLMLVASLLGLLMLVASFPGLLMLVASVPGLLMLVVIARNERIGNPRVENMHLTTETREALTHGVFFSILV